MRDMRQTPEGRAELNRRVRASRRKRKAEVVQAYGGVCTCCGEDDIRFLTVDHVNDDGGGRDRPTHGAVFYRSVIREGFPNRYTVLCVNCNTGRAWNGGVCPHQERLNVEAWLNG